jgi:hypothetical protein
MVAASSLNGRTEFVNRFCAAGVVQFRGEFIFPLPEVAAISIA